MQAAETVLDVLRERGRRGLPLERRYRQLFNPQLYLLAYGRLYSNHGAMTPGVDGETVDGMSQIKIARIIDALRHERYRFTPVKRVYIPKKNGKMRPLGLPSWSDKLVGEVIRLLLEAYYEPQFSGRSHGFRPGRGCHTALSEVAVKWTGTTWFIEGDIARCFDELDHEIMLEILVKRSTTAGFWGFCVTCCEPDTWRIGNGTRRSPARRRAGWSSPILSNIYLDRLDNFVETVLIPEYTRGNSAGTTRSIRRCSARSRRPANAVTVSRCARCAGNCAACPPGILAIPATGGCGTAGTPMIICSGSPDRKPRPNRSNGAWRGSCMTISSWNCPRRRP